MHGNNLSPPGSTNSAHGPFPAVYDSLGHRMIVYGGNTRSRWSPDETLSDVWALNLVTLVWTQLVCTGYTPGARCYHDAICRSATNEMVRILRL